MKQRMFIFLFLLPIIIACGNPTNKKLEEKPMSENHSQVRKLYARLFMAMNDNDMGKLSDADFKKQADSLTVLIDSIKPLLTDDEKKKMQKFYDDLLDDLIKKKAKRDNN